MKVIFIIAALLGSMFISTPALAAPGDNRCITKAEFHAVHIDMTKHHAHYIIDYQGTEVWFIFGSGGPARQGRSYHQCGGKRGSAEVDYHKLNGRWYVTGKTSHWRAAADGATLVQAELGDNHCITKTEFGQVHVRQPHHPVRHPGMLRYRVYGIVDSRGHKAWTHGVAPVFQGRTWLRCGHPADWAEIDFSKQAGHRWHAYDKTPHWGNG